MPSVSIPATVTTALVSGAATAAVGLVGNALLAGGGPKAPPAPAAPAPAPTMDQNAINEATAKQTALASATSGRQSTMVSQGGSDKLGG